MLKIWFCLLLIMPTVGFGNEKYSWVDLPTDNLRDILYEYDDQLDQLNGLVQYYHGIDKVSWNKLDARIDTLRKIAHCANRIQTKIKSEYLLNTTKKYSSLATEKARYLQQLKELKKYKYQARKRNIFNPNAVLHPYFPLLLNNERKLEYKTQEFWGQYFIEAIDPCHRRQLTSYHEVWSKKCKKCELLDFFMWLEEQNVSIFLPRINSLSKEELKRHKIFIKRGKFYFPSGRLATTESSSVPAAKSQKDKNSTKINFSEDPIFVIDAQGNMFLTYSSDNNAHVTLSDYLPLIGSGAIHLKQGEAQSISFKSGHYLPEIKHFTQAIRFFENKGIHLDNNIEITYYLNHKEYISTLIEFKKKYMNL